MNAQPPTQPSRRQVRLALEAQQELHRRREQHIQAIADRAGWRVLAITEHRAALLIDDSTIHLVQLDDTLFTREWTVGECLATLTRDAMDQGQFERLADVLVG